MNEEYPVVVEGRKDERALRSIGLKGKIIRLNRGVSVFQTTEQLAREYRKVILLTDWDRRGGQLSRLLKDGLEANGAQYDETIRINLAFLCKKDIKDVESLSRHLSRMRELFEGERRKIPL